VSEAHPSPIDAASRLHILPQRVYRFRMLGMGLGALPLFAVLRELDAAWPAWAWVAWICFLWPHVAYVLARRSADPFRAELLNLTLDSAFAASAVPLIAFNLLPSVLLLTVAVADKVNSGIRGLWVHSLPAMLIGGLASVLVAGWAWRPETSMAVMLASLPILVIHTLAVSANSYRLIRKVQKQNVKLDELARLDALTGLDSRGHWQAQAAALLARHHADGIDATLMLVDVDRFKDINDRHGHATGDDVLRGIAELIRRTAPEGSAAGRLGGDEFAVAMPVSRGAAEVVANELRHAVDALRFPRLSTLRCSVSIGCAQAPGSGIELREWIEAADGAMYEDKERRRSGAAAIARA
jgi:diguanylate cyclase